MRDAPEVGRARPGTRSTTSTSRRSPKRRPETGPFGDRHVASDVAQQLRHRVVVGRAPAVEAGPVHGAGHDLPALADLEDHAQRVRHAGKPTGPDGQEASTSPRVASRIRATEAPLTCDPMTRTGYGQGAARFVDSGGHGVSSNESRQSPGRRRSPHSGHGGPSAKDRIAAGIADGSVRGLVDEISGEVDAIDKGLAWELSKGAASRHALVVSPEGDPALRPVALDWLAAAPARRSRLGVPREPAAGPARPAAARWGRRGLADYRAIAGWDEGRERVDVRLWHPGLTGAIAESPGCGPPTCSSTTCSGRTPSSGGSATIDLLDDADGGRTPDELRAEVERRAAEATGEAWTLDAAERRRAHQRQRGGEADRPPVLPAASS